MENFFGSFEDFGNMQQQVQIVKDGYYKMMKKAASNMTHEYEILNGKVDAAIKKFQNYPAEPNQNNEKILIIEILYK